MARKTLVLAEARDSVLRHVSFEAVAAAKRIADGGEIVALLCGDHVGDEAKVLGYYGADRVLVVENDALKNYTPDGYKQVLKEIVDTESPEAIVMGHTSIGKGLAAGLAARLDSALISDVTGIEMNGSED